MLKKTVKYVDYFGNEQEEELYFNLNKPEMMRLEISTELGVVESIKRSYQEKDYAAIMVLFEKIIKMAYGKIGEDGRTFVKDPKAAEEFMNSKAYEVVFEELFMNDDGDSIMKFFAGLFSIDMSKVTPAMMDRARKELEQPSVGNDEEE